jgi:(E)-4-hydroxy-3-methylbut-2-enyl-diphosphate synthase
LPYPLHLGVTEAGTLLDSAIKSSAALGALLMDGIGDTLRISVSDDPVEEMKIAKKLLKCFGLYDKIANLIACPTCGRLQYDMLPIVKEVEAYLNTLDADVTVAVMGCAVNGPQEAKRADIGVAGGVNEALLFRKGVYIRSIKQEDILAELKLEIQDYLKTGSR